LKLFDIIKPSLQCKKIIYYGLIMNNHLKIIPNFSGVKKWDITHFQPGF
jgi:hypothetical protein